jgi:carboxyl-terminal processing protease
MYHMIVRSKVKAALFLSIALVVASMACRASVEIKGDTNLIWEVWDSVQLSYVKTDNLDSQIVVNNVVLKLLELANESPYPFLTEIGRMRGQPTANVAPELVDVWRALTLHRKKWPEYSDAQLADTAIKGILESLGDSAVAFMANSEDYARARETLTGSYEGVGASLIMENERILLFPLLEQVTELERAGIESRDVLLEVDGNTVVGLSVEEAAMLMRGPAGTSVKLLVERIGVPEPLEHNVFRREIDRLSIVSQPYPGGIWYIGVRKFLENTGDQVLEVLETFQKHEMLALILDLRSNPGGSSAAAQILLSQFLQSGELVMYEMTLDGSRTDWVAIEGDLELQDVPVVVLTNEGTAGVSEAVVAALRDSRRATIIGTQTFGNATSYDFVELSNGSTMYLPMSQWYSSSGQLLDGVSIQPDIWAPYQLVEQGFGERQFNLAYDFLNSKLPPFR